MRSRMMHHQSIWYVFYLVAIFLLIFHTYFPVSYTRSKNYNCKLHSRMNYSV
jgi:hypothetical protein